MEQKLVQVERGNVVLRVPDYDVQRYIDQGYNLIDDKGNVYIWSSQEDLGMYFEQDTKSVTIKGTVKEHKEYKGIQQTVLYSDSQHHAPCRRCSSQGQYLY